MFTDFVMNGRGHGEVGNMVSHVGFDTNLLRPFLDSKGNRCVLQNTGEWKLDKESDEMVPITRKITVNEAVNKGILPIANAQTMLTKDAWIRLDRAVLLATRDRLRAWGDLRARNTLGGFDGMAKTILEWQRMTDPGEAMVDMDGLSEGNADQAKLQLEGLPLPITHSSFTFSKRELAVSRNGGMGLDVTGAEWAGRRVAETIEKTLIGSVTGMTYGDATQYDNTPTVYGYTNHPDRITKTDLTTPTGVSTSDSTVQDILAMRQLAYDQKFFGPYMLYHSTNWDQFLDGSYLEGTIAQGLAAPTQTLRNRILQIEGIQAVRRLDFFTDSSELLLVDMNPTTVRAVNGMAISTVQWQEIGGLRLHFKVMAIQVPNIRSQFIGQNQTNAAAKAGIVHGTTS